ncbi:MAG: hypothetical protein IJ703_01415 [Eubacterium sp.]|nr:hypothetical protein [Eubacterium sp.]
MNIVLLDLMKKIELLNNDDLDRIKTWVEYVASKRENTPNMASENTL